MIRRNKKMRQLRKADASLKRSKSEDELDIMNRGI